RAPARVATRRPARRARDHTAAGSAPSVLHALVRRARAAHGQARVEGRRLQLPARLGPPVPAGGGARGVAPPRRLLRPAAHAARRLDRRSPYRVGGMNALTAVDATPGLAAYLAELEARLARAVDRRPGSAAEVSCGALSAGGKRLRPLLCFLSS